MNQPTNRAGEPARSRILTINGGSSSLKFAIFDRTDPPSRLLSGRVDRIGLEDARWSVDRAGGEGEERRTVDAPDQETASRLVMDWLESSGEFGEVAAIAAKLHGASAFHKDLYLCHLFVDPGLTAPAGRRLTLIDLHRMGTHRLTGGRWRVKDLAQLVYSTEGVEGIDASDIEHFWSTYCALARVRKPSWLRARVASKAARYLGHNRKGRPR